MSEEMEGANWTMAMSGGRIRRGIDSELVEQFPTCVARFLVAIHHDDINVAKTTRLELMNRGFNGEGCWVGFAKAGELLGV